MPRILYNETQTTIILFGGSTWIYPKGSKDPKKPDHVEIKTELATHPHVLHVLNNKSVSMLSLEAAAKRQNAVVTEPVVPAVPVETTPVTASAPAPAVAAVEATPAAVGTVEDEKAEVAAPVVEKEVVEEKPSDEEKPTTETTEATEAPRHGKKNKKNRQ